MKWFFAIIVSILAVVAGAQLHAADFAKPETIIFERYTESNEQAFTILVPRGWHTDGGIIRVNPVTQGGAAQSIAAKVDFTVKNDAAGAIMIRWLPDMLYFDARMSPAGQMGLFPAGSNYNGMTVWPKLPAAEFVKQFVIPSYHPGISDLTIVEQQSLPELAQQYLKRVKALVPGLTFSYDVAIITLTYQENGISYREKIFTVIEDWGQVGAGMWGNKEMFLIRAPAKHFDQWEPVFSIIQQSVQISPQWLAGELRGQAQRGEIMINTQQEMQRIEREIVNNRQQTNAEIHNDMFLTLTDQEEYVNPYTNQVETGSNQWQHRWVNESGDVIYSDRADYNPNTDLKLNRSDFKKTPVRPR